MKPTRHAISEERFGLAVCGFALLIFIGSVSFTSVANAQLAQIRSLQDQLAAPSPAQDSGTGGTGDMAPSSVTAPTTRYVTLVAEEAKQQIATNVTYDAWTFNGTAPGPTITVNQGDTVVFKLINNDTMMAHSIDFHAAEIDWSTAYATVAPGQSKSFNFTANYPGIFMYHCGTPPVLEHIGNGMYGAIIVNPATPLAPATGGQYVLVQSEFYLNQKPGPDGSFAGNYTKMLANTPDYVVFNGKANQYQKTPLVVQPNQLVRLYILNVGPNQWSAFHVIGAIMDSVYTDGNPANVQHGLQTLSIPPSGGAMVEMYFRDPGGKNPFVTHDFADASIGAVGVFSVASSSTATTTTSQAQFAGTSVKISIPSGSASDMKSTGYLPSTVTLVIGVNNSVTWTNNDKAPHTITASDKSFDSGNLNQGDSWSHVFTTPGTYHYSCAYHPWMQGTIVVKSS